MALGPGYTRLLTPPESGGYGPRHMKAGGLLNFLRREVLVGEYEVFHRTLREALVGTCESVLDVGCGFRSPLGNFSHLIPRTVGVDGTSTPSSAAGPRGSTASTTA